MKLFLKIIFVMQAITLASCTSEENNTNLNDNGLFLLEYNFTINGSTISEQYHHTDTFSVSDGANLVYKNSDMTIFHFHDQKESNNGTQFNVYQLLNYNNNGVYEIIHSNESDENITVPSGRFAFHIDPQKNATITNVIDDFAENKEYFTVSNIKNYTEYSVTYSTHTINFTDVHMRYVEANYESPNDSKDEIVKLNGKLQLSFITP